MITKRRILLISLVLITLFIFTAYKSALSPVDYRGNVQIFTIDSGSTIDGIVKDLKEEGLIKSNLAFKLYVKLNNINNFQSGAYELSTAMGVQEIASKFQLGDIIYPDGINITFPEGITLEEMAELLSYKINYSKEEILSRWNDSKFVDDAISHFDMLSDDIKNDNIDYPLNGYFFPATYFLKNSDIAPEEIAWSMLNKMDDVISKYETEVDEQEFSIHELMTLASIIEYEAKYDQDRPIISGVFHNRLKTNMKLQSCATLNMALGVHKKVYTHADINVHSPYNTYYVGGLPVGPGNCPSSKSIEAAIRPAKHDYYYFLSDIYNSNETFYSTTLEEHNQLKNKYLR